MEHLADKSTINRQEYDGSPVPKPVKQVNNDFCPQCGQTYPRDQREYHLLNHYQAMNKEVLGALEKIRQELAGRAMTQSQST
jgi:hypothetical protein